MQGGRKIAESHMEKTFVARASVDIAASMDKVWGALVNPQMIKKCCDKFSGQSNRFPADKAMMSA